MLLAQQVVAQEALPLVQVLATVLSHATGWAGAGVCTGCAVYTSNAKMADGMR